MVWEDHTGTFTASLIDDTQSPPSHGTNLHQALTQLKEYLDWTFKEYPWRAGPNVLDAKLVFIRVEVRPEYKAMNRSFHGERPLAFRVPVIHGRRPDHLFYCSIPTLEIRFDYHEQQRLKELVKDSVVEKLRGRTPQQLSRFFEPRSAFLEEIVVQTRSKTWSSIPHFRVDTLEAIADPIHDVKQKARLSRAWERESEVADLIRRLSIEKANVIIVAEPGAGKSAVLGEAVRRLERSETQDGLRDSAHRYWRTSGLRLIAGMEYLGEWQERCQRMILELSDIGGVLCFENLHELLQTSGGGPEAGVASFFKPYLERGELRIIAEATPGELDACRRIAPAFVELFQLVTLNRHSRGQTLGVLSQAAKRHQSNHKISISIAVLATAYRLFRQFRPYDAFPGAALLFLDQMVETAILEKRPSIGIEDCIRGFSRQTGLPEIFLQDDSPLNTTDVLQEFQSRVLGQEEACRAAAQLVAAFKAGVNDPNRPLGVMLFCGPTGVGKTELARTIAEYFFGRGESSDQRLARLDMSEYSNPWAAQSLLTAPDGGPSDFIRRVRRQPFCVLLFDEIEKADPAVFDLLLSVLDEGRLTDRFGRITNFRSAIIVMTSNLGADQLESVGFENQFFTGFERAARRFFRPEFFNRIDSILQFQPLSPESMRRIAVKELNQVSAREGMKMRNLKLEWDEGLVDHMIRTGFSLKYGARPLQRTLESLVIVSLAKFLLDHPEAQNTRLRLSLGIQSELQIEMVGRP